MSKEILQDIIKDFDFEKFIRFFREKNRAFAPRTEDLSQYDDDNFSNGIKLGEIEFTQDETMLICAFRVERSLSERSGKKAQYEKGKKILKYTNADAGIFIFYDRKGNFRFSLIYPEYTGTKRQWSYFKRFTYFVSPELTNKTFLQQIGDGDFSSLQKIKEAFSVDPVTKQFYDELQSWYFWAIDKIKFPDDYKHSNDPQKDKEIRNATNLIRLITRTIFIWFLAEKGLVPTELFSKEKLKKIVKDFMQDKKASNFYNAILQNLFFGTLNQKMDERKFADERGYPANKKEYGVKNLYRYADKFLISKNEVLSLFKDIPFLNGGLFDCLDKEDETGKVIYVDGFSRNPKKQAIIPDYLFFQEKEEKVDLSQYGLGSNKTVRGLIEILNSYNFTIDENTPVDQEIALDPELLGKVFENLLASYNPETATTARKATGSYYTPREIVDYMVEESLIAYLKNTINDPARLRQLLSYSEDTPEFSDDERQNLISAIDNIKILDPACGSGAFPMGILHKLVHALQKIDPENKYWHELQYQKALKESEEVFKQGDKNQRQEMLKEINEAFDEGINYPDYARKLYLIENCIYGVDIQPIAIQISKLRFFISLVLDQKVDRSKENLGIRALPNLETKFVAANTLIQLEIPRHIFYTDKIRKLEDEIKSLRHRYFLAKTRTQKLRYQEKDKKLRGLLADELKRIGFPSDSSEKIAAFDLYDQNTFANWFDPEWMFGITDGFDIVIGNPPYGNLIKDETERNLVERTYKYSTVSDISSPFIEKGFNLLKDNGNLLFIITYAITFNKNFSKSRELISNGFEECYIYSFDRDKCRIFESMTQSVSVMKCFNKNSSNKKGLLTSRMFRNTPNIYNMEVCNANAYLLPKGSKINQRHRLPKIGEKINEQILKKILTLSGKVESITKNKGTQIWIRTSGNYWYNAFDKKPYNSCEILPLYVNENFANFLIVLMNSSLFYFWFRIYGDGRHMNTDILENFPLPASEKILKYNILLEKIKNRFMEKLFSVFDKTHNKFNTSLIKSEIDLLDLILGKYFYGLNYEEIDHILNYDSEVRKGKKLTQPFIDLVDKIILMSKVDYHNQNEIKQPEVKKLEHQIDEMLYELYGLTEDEIAIVDGISKG